MVNITITVGSVSAIVAAASALHAQASARRAGVHAATAGRRAAFYDQDADAPAPAVPDPPAEVEAGTRDRETLAAVSSGTKTEAAGPIVRLPAREAPAAADTKGGQP